MTTKLSEDDLFCIFDFFYSDRDLRSLCLCCKLFNQLLQPRLYYRIDLVGHKSHTKTSTSVAAFRQLLEHTPHLAHYPRKVDISLRGCTMEDIEFVLAALTGKNISFVALNAHGHGPVAAPVRRALETFLRDTVIPLNVTISSFQAISASCLHLTQNLSLINSVIDPTGPPGVFRIKTLSIDNWGGGLSIGAPFFSNVLPCLTHLMLSWEAPSGEPGGWYADLGAALDNMPKLILFTVQYWGGCTQDSYIEAYASKMQNAMGNRPDRVSLNWRFLYPMEPNALRLLKSLRGLSGWNTISFQVDNSHELEEQRRQVEEMIQVAMDTFLKHSDNSYVRIDEIRGWSSIRQRYYGSGDAWERVPCQSTLVIKGHTLDAVDRHVHEDVYSHPPCTRTAVREGRNPGRRRWEARIIRI